MTGPVQLVLDRLTEAGCPSRRSGSAWSAKCPAHDDKSPSLSVSEGSDGRALITCHAGCSLDAVLEVLKLQRKDLFPPKARQDDKARIVAVYDYVDAQGMLLFQVVRLEGHQFYQRRPNGKGGWLKKLGDVRRVAYRLPEVLAAVAAKATVFVAEGEKDVDSLVRAGVMATCNSEGAGKWRVEHAEALYGASEVVVIADADKPGRDHAGQVVDTLRGHVAHLVIAEALEGKDASDHLAAGHGVDEFTVVYDSASAPDSDSRTAGVLERVCQALRRFIVWRSDEQVEFVALWVLHTYLYEVFDTTPYLDISSAAKRSGKSRLLELLKLLVSRPWYVVEPSEAVLFRKVDAEKPTLLVDEVDASFGKDPKGTEGLRAIYNDGWRVGATVPRCVGNDHKPVDFEVYCPKAFAGLNGLPDTVRDRSGRVELRRRARHEPKPERLRLSKARAELEPLRADLAYWALSVADTLAGTEPPLPEALNDRAQDACEVLAAIADLAGGTWPERARKAFVNVMGGEEDTDYGTVLLAHVHDAFDALGTDVTGAPVDRITTAELLGHLVHRGDDSPWANWWGKDVEASDLLKPSQGLARALRPFEVRSKNLRLGGAIVKGYFRADFADAWDRYVPR